MKLTVLGSGTMLPTAKRFPSSFLLDDGKTKILLDAGHGALARLAEIGVDPRKIDAVFISHFHADHFGDAFNLVHARFVGDLYQKKEHDSLTFIGPESIRKRFETWRSIHWVEPEEDYPIVFLEDENNYSFGDFKLEMFPVIHVPWFKSIGVIVCWKGKKIVYPGDVGSRHEMADLVRRAEDADLLVIEAGYENPSPNHFSTGQIEELSSLANVKKVLIVHQRPIEEEENRIAAFAGTHEKFIVAEDRMVIDFGA